MGTRARNNTKWLTNVFPRLSEIRDWCMDGKTNEEMCVLLGISPDSWYTYMKQYSQLNDIVTAGKSVIDSDFLLIGQRGAFKRNAINLILEKYGQRVSVEVTPHQLRHSLGYRLVKDGTAITTIQGILGYDSILTTNLYTVTTEQDKVEALEALEWEESRSIFIHLFQWKGCFYLCKMAQQ